MSKAAAAAKGLKGARKVVRKVDHKGRVFTYIPAQMASPAPPLGSQLGQIGVNIANFVKEFNLRTSIFKEGVPIPTVVTINPDRSHNMEIRHPPYSYFLMQAAGIQRGAMEAWKGEIAGMVTRKHVYEIAKLKSEDNYLQMFDLQVICKEIIDEAYNIGIKVVDHLDPKEYEKFLQERAEIVEQQKKDIQAKREAKLLRTAV